MNLAGILKLKSEINSIQMRLALRRISFALKFDESQPRVPAGQTGGGQWTGSGGTGGRAVEVPARLQDVSIDRSKRHNRLAFRTENDCDEQYKRDIFQCRMVGLRSCYAQAMVRLVACERGHPVPPLNY
jgi:hypothetical protein